MRKPDIAKQIARKSKVSRAEAADRLDLLLNQIVAELRNGGEAVLPGLGRFRTGPDGHLGFEPEKGGKRD